MKKRDINTLRAKHKQRINIFLRTEKVLCTGEPSRFEVTRFFWKNVECQKCLKLGGKG